jgi:hypothetical protein
VYVILLISVNMNVVSNYKKSLSATTSSVAVVCVLFWSDRANAVNRGGGLISIMCRLFFAGIGK